MSNIRKVLADDRRLVTYRPRLREIAGSVTATILLQQILFWWDVVGERPFYKFFQPCDHELYKAGDSWTEELGFSYAELSGALKKIGAKITAGSNKTALLAENMVIYWTDANRVTWYQVNEEIVDTLLEQVYSRPNSTKSNYLDNSTLSNCQETEESRITFLSETTSKITIEETCADAPISPDPGSSEPETSTEIKDVPPASVYTETDGAVNVAVAAGATALEMAAALDEFGRAAGQTVDLAEAATDDPIGGGGAPAQEPQGAGNGGGRGKNPGQESGKTPTGRNVLKAALQEHFCAATGIPAPELKTAAQRKAAGALWFAPMLEIAGLAGDDEALAKRLVDLSVERLRRGGLTIASPRSLVNTARAVLGEINSGLDPEGGGRSAERLIQGPTNYAALDLW